MEGRDRFFRRRPDWYTLVFQCGLGAVVSWQALDDLLVGHWRIYSGEFYPWRSRVPSFFAPPLEFYWGLLALEIALLVLYFARVRVRWTGALLALVLLLDGLFSYLNHRLLMAVQLFLVSLRPVPRDASAQGFRRQRTYWNLDLVRWQIAMVYLFTAIHKMNPDFLNGWTLRNLFWMVRNAGWRHYPEWLFYDFLQSPSWVRFLACATVLAELFLAFGLNFRRTVGWAIPIAIVLHVSFALFMPFIWIFLAEGHRPATMPGWKSCPSPR